MHAKRPAALSPTRVNTFQKCPLQFRLQNVDQIPTRQTAAMVRGTLVHAVLEDLFDFPAEQRTLETALASLVPHWQQMLAQEPTLSAEIFDNLAEKSIDQAEDEFLGQARHALQHYFSLENPQFLEPAHREMYLHVVLENGLRLRGIIDRVDKNASGLVRIVDYKTGKAPKPQYLAPYLLQLRFYALLWQRTYGELPARLQLLFLKDQQSYAYCPVEADLEATFAELSQVWEQIAHCIEQRYFPPRRSPLCNWCDLQAYCPCFGGQVPPIPEEALAHLGTTANGTPPLT